MRQRKGLILIAALALGVLLGGCGKQDNGISDGVKNMKDVLVDIKAAVDSGDSLKAQTGADQLEEAWSKFEDNVKDKSADLYEKTETPLHAIEAGVKSIRSISRLSSNRSTSSVKPWMNS